MKFIKKNPLLYNDGCFLDLGLPFIYIYISTHAYTVARLVFIRWLYFKINNLCQSRTVLMDTVKYHFLIIHKRATICTVHSLSLFFNGVMKFHCSIRMQYLLFQISGTLTFLNLTEHTNTYLREERSNIRGEI